MNDSPLNPEDLVWIVVQSVGFQEDIEVIEIVSVEQNYGRAMIRDIRPCGR